MRLLFPDARTLTRDPISCANVALEIAVAVAVACLEQAQQGVPQCRIHTNGISGEVATHTMASKSLLKETLLICATTVEVSRRRRPWRICPLLSPEIMP
jgi:hypothetical protein